MTWIIFGVCFLGACLPLSRIVLIYIKRSNKYSEEFKQKAVIYRNIFVIVCMVLAVILLLIINKAATE